MNFEVLKEEFVTKMKVKDILTGKKSIFAYLMKPVLSAKERAMTER